MKKITTAIALAGAAALLAGCTAISTPARSGGEVLPKSDSSTSFDTSSVDALDVLRGTQPYFRDVPDHLIEDAAVSVCDALDAGASFGEVILVIATSDIDPEAGGALLGYAVFTECQEYTDEMVAFAGSFG